jgi:acid phosphatase
MSKHSLKAFVAVIALLSSAVAVTGTADARDGGDNPLRKIKHIVVIYEENHSFDNLYGGWEGVNGLANADAAHTTQVDINGAPLPCLPQNEVNLASPTPLPAVCTVSAGTKPGTSLSGGLANAPFAIDNYIAPTDSTCPPALQAFSFPNGILKGQTPGRPGGCTRDLVHKFYHEQYQINGGQMNRYVTGSDAIGLTMGHYDTKALPIYKYLHGHDAPNYAIADNFFQAAFGGSFLNHQWLIAARTPVLANAPAALHAVLTSDGHPRNN